MVGDVAGIVLGPDEARLTAPEKIQPDPIQARGVNDDAALVADLPLSVEHRHIEPRVVRPVPGRQYDGVDLATQLHRQSGGVVDRSRRETCRRSDLTIHVVLACPFIEFIEESMQLQIGEGGTCSQAILRSAPSHQQWP